METISTLFPVNKTLSMARWQRTVLLIMIGYEALGALLGGLMLLAAPDGRLMNMPVSIMHGAFPDFFMPGLILFALGLLNSVAFMAVMRRSSMAWLLSGLAMGGLTIWFLVEIAILQELHWLHAMWGLPVVMGDLLTFPMIPRNQAVKKMLLVCGILSSALYVAMNVFIPMLDSHYDSAAYTVSELSAIGAPTRTLWITLGYFYTFLVGAFGWGIVQSSPGNRALRITGIFVVVYAVVNLFWPFAPMHTREVLAAGGGTLTDTLHLTLAGVTVFIMVLAMAFGAAALDKRFRIYTIVTVLVMLVFGLLTSLDAPKVEANLPTPYAGVWERINIGVFLIWTVVLARILLRKTGK